MIMRPDLRICGIEAGAEIKSWGMEYSHVFSEIKFPDSRERKRNLNKKDLQLQIQWGETNFVTFCSEDVKNTTKKTILEGVRETPQSHPQQQTLNHYQISH